MSSIQIKRELDLQRSHDPRKTKALRYLLIDPLRDDVRQGRIIWGKGVGELKKRGAMCLFWTRIYLLSSLTLANPIRNKIILQPISSP